MDDKPLEELVSGLESADPAEAADMVDAVVAELTQRLDAITEEAPAAPEA